MTTFTRALTTSINEAAMLWLAWVFAQVMLFGRFVVFEPNPFILVFEFMAPLIALPLNLLHFWQDIPAAKTHPRPLTKQQKLSLGVRQ